MTRDNESNCAARTIKHTSGQALVPVLFIVLILTAVAVMLSLSARQETRAAASYLRETQEYYIARGAVQYAAAELQEATNGGTTFPQLAPPPDTDANGWTQCGDGWYKVEIIDTTSRLNINTSSLAMLQKLPACQSDPNIAAAIVDWRDADDNPTTDSTSTGAESDYYESLTPQYLCKNAPFDTVDELLLVRGITPSILYGTVQPNDVSDTNSATTSSSRAALTRQTSGTTTNGNTIDTSQSTTPLGELITTYSKEPNYASDGTKRVNVLTATASDMQTKLGISATVANAIVSARGTNGTGLTSVADLLNVTGVTRTLMQQIGDKVTTTDAEERDGVININTAPEEVLAAIPTITADTYNAILEARESGTVFNGLNDLFTLTSINRTQLQALLNNVCTKSSVYLVRVKVRMNGSNRVYVVQALVELSPPATDTTNTNDSPSSSTSISSNSSSSEPMAKILQWREIQRSPGWSTWIAPPSYYNNNPVGGSVGSS